MGIKKRIPEIFLLLTVSLLLCQFAWTGSFSFEFSFLMSTFIFIIFLPSAMFRLSAQHSFKEKLIELKNYFVLLGIPLLIVLLYGTKYGICNFGIGLSWFMLLPAVTTIYSVGCAFFAKSFKVSKFWQWLLALAPTILFSILTLIDLYFDPQISFYHPVLGYFPGPLYDEWIPLFGSLIAYRVWLILFSIWILSKSSVKKKYWIMMGVILLPLLFRGNLGWHYSHSHIQKLLHGHITTQYADIYFSNLQTKSMNHFSRSIDFYVEDISKKLKIPPPTQRIRIYIYNDSFQKKLLTGTGNTFVGNPMQKALHILPTDISDTILVHELSHVVASPLGIPFLKISPKIGLLEGLATSFQLSQMDLSPHEWAKAMLDIKQLPDLNHSLNAISFWKDNPTRVYLASGSFVQWLIETQGIEKFKHVYRGETFKKNYFQTLPLLLDAWKKFLSTIHIDQSSQELVSYFLSKKPFYQKKCVHEVARWEIKFDQCMKNKKKCDSYIYQACQLDPNNPSLRLQRARYLFKTEPFLPMDTTMIPLPSPENPRVQNNLIQLFNDDMHQIQDAHHQYDLSQYQHPSFDFSNSIMARIYLSKHSQEVLRGILLGSYVPDLHLTWPKDVFYNQTMFYFSRLSSNRGESEKSLSFLQKINLQEETSEFKTAYLEQLALSYEAVGKYKDAGIAYQKITELSTSEGKKAFAQLQIDRLQYLLKQE